MELNEGQNAKRLAWFGVLYKFISCAINFVLLTFEI